MTLRISTKMDSLWWSAHFRIFFTVKRNLIQDLRQPVFEVWILELRDGLTSKTLFADVQRSLSGGTWTIKRQNSSDIHPICSHLCQLFADPAWFVLWRHLTWQYLEQGWDSVVTKDTHLLYKVVSTAWYPQVTLVLLSLEEVLGDDEDFLKAGGHFTCWSAGDIFYWLEDNVEQPLHVVITPFSSEEPSVTDDPGAAHTVWAWLKTYIWVNGWGALSHAEFSLKIVCLYLPVVSTPLMTINTKCVFYSTL